MILPTHHVHVRPSRLARRSRTVLVGAAALLAVVATAQSVRAGGVIYPEGFDDCIGIADITADESDYLCEGGPGGSGGSGDESAPTDATGSGDDCEDEDDPWNKTDDPVDVRYGSKVETAVDMTVRLPGQDFNLVRRHASNLTGSTDRPNYIGAGWTLNNFSKIQYVQVGSNPDVAFLVTGGNTRVRFEEIDTTGALDGDWLSPPGSRLVLQYFNQPLNKLGDPTETVANSYFVLIDPGRMVRYYRFQDGRLVREIDMAGNVIEHVATTGSSGFFRPDHLMFYTRAEALAAHPRPNAILNINYTKLGTGPEQFVSLMQLLRPANRDRPDSGETAEQKQQNDEYVVTQEARYTYVGNAPAGKSFDLGLLDDLVQVETYELTNAGLHAAATATMSTPAAQPTDLRIKFSDLEPWLANGTGGPSENPAYRLDAQLEMAKATDARRRVTQYRYYTSSGPTIDGTLGQIKMIFAPEQIEHYELHNTSSSDSWALLNKDDVDSAGLASPLGSHKVQDIASKRVAYYPQGDSFEFAVKEETILASCGCSGASAVGKRIAYTYFQDGVVGAEPPNHYDSSVDIVRSVLVDEYQQTGTLASPSEKAHRRLRYDLIDVASDLGSAGNDNPQYRTLYRAIWAYNQDTGALMPSPWVWRREYFGNNDPDGPSGLVKREYEPSSFARHWIGAGAPGFPEFVADGGLVTHYTYYAERERTVNQQVLPDHRYGQVKSVAVSEAQKTGSDWDSYSLISEYDYEHDQYRSDLLTKVVRHRDEGQTAPQIETASIGGSASREVTVIDNVLNPSIVGRVQRIHQKVEVETTSENGRTGVAGNAYETVTVFNEHNDVVVIASADTATEIEDSSRTDYEYHSVHGEMITQKIRPIATGAAGFYGDDDQGQEPADTAQLISRFGHDVDGRLMTIVEPTGAVINRWREMQNWPVDNKSRFAIVTLPSASNSGATEFAGPIATEYFTAADKSLGAKEQVATSVTRTDDDGDGVNEAPSGSSPYSAGTELSKTWFIRSISGLALESRSFEDVTSTDPYVTEFFYDGLGRLRLLRTPNATTRRFSYDIFDRVTLDEIGVYAAAQALSGADTSTDFVTTMEYFYDGSDSSPATQGAGNGNLRLVRQRLDATNYRDAEFWYDFRDREIASLSMVDNSGNSHGALRQTITYDNLDRPTATEQFDGGDGPDFSAGTRAWFEETLYNQRGLPFRSRVATEPTQDPPTNFLVWNTWYDQQSRVIAAETPSAPATKRQFDGIGRLTATYITDRGGDSGTSWTHAATLTSDNVLEQVEYRYREESNVSATTQVAEQSRRLRAHADETGAALPTGPLSGDIADSTYDFTISTYSAIFYDEAGRPIRIAEYGSNSSNDLFEARTAAPWAAPATWPPNPIPSADALVDLPLVTELDYNNRGLIDSVTAPDETVTAIVYDDTDRRVGLIENATGTRTVARDTSGDGTPWEAAATPGNSLFPWATDEDRTTIFIYDGADNLTHRIAVNVTPGASSEQEQITTYEYGVNQTQEMGLVSSELTSNDLLSKVIYPDELGAGNAAIRYSYNRIGEVISVRDQNGTRHDYERDSQGRVELDRVAENMWGDSTAQGNEWTIDRTVDRIAYTYDAIGRLTQAESKNDTTVVNAVGYSYAPNYKEQWALTGFRQNPRGALGGATEAAVEYDYSSSTSMDDRTHHRVGEIKYPSAPANRTSLTMDYGTANDLSYAISRPRGFYWGLGKSAKYEYVGLRIPVKKSYQSNDVTMDRFVDPDDDDSTGTARQNGVYPGLDRYGRVKRQVWYIKPSGMDWVGPRLYANGGRPAIVDFTYSYDNGSDVRTREDTRFGRGVNGQDELYSYDGLNRLIQADRGLVTAGALTTPAVTSQKWTLDHLGNQTEVITDTQNTIGSFDAGTDLTLTRIYNLANEVTTQDSAENSVTTSMPVRFDTSGNQLDDHTKAYTFDAWNRLVAVSIDGKPRAQYTYYPMHQRATRKADNTYMESPIVFDEHDLFYYDASWRLFEERRYGAAEFTGDPETIIQRLWGLTYIDEYLGQMVDETWDNAGVPTAPDGDMTTHTVVRHYAVTDRRHDVIASLDATGTPVERIRYTAYGVAQARRLHDPAPPHGEINGADLGFVTSGNIDYGDPDYKAEADVNFDGKNGGADLGIVLGDWGTYDAPEGKVSLIGASSVGYAGYLYDDAVDLYIARFRWYSASNARWVNRDPIEYFDGSNLYSYVNAQPITRLDPFGLSSSTPDCGSGGGGGDLRDSEECKWRQRQLTNFLDALKRRCGIQLNDYRAEMDVVQDALKGAGSTLAEVFGEDIAEGIGGALRQAHDFGAEDIQRLKDLMNNPHHDKPVNPFDLWNKEGTQPIKKVGNAAGHVLEGAGKIIGVTDIAEGIDEILEGDILTGAGRIGVELLLKSSILGIALSAVEIGVDAWLDSQVNADNRRRLNATCRQHVRDIANRYRARDKACFGIDLFAN